MDRLVEAWQRERSDLDLRPMEVLSRVTRLGHHLDRARRQAFAEHDIESWEFDVLAALRRAGTPYELSPGRLLRETLVTSGTMTNRVDRLAARGLVERLPDPHDRRGVLVRLTGSGRSTVDGALEGLLLRERRCSPGSTPPTRSGSPGCCATSSCRSRRESDGRRDLAALPVRARTSTSSG